MNLLAADHFQLLKSFLAQALLSLGASPNYKDRCGLTPLYHTVLAGGDTTCCETLLYYRAKIGTRDENGWDESHQVPMNSSALAHRVALVLNHFLTLHRLPAHLCLLPVNWSNASTPVQLHPSPTPSPLSRHSPHLSACLPSLPSSRPFSPSSSLSLRSTGTKRSLEWKKSIRYSSPLHPVVITRLFHSQRLRKVTM